MALHYNSKTNPTGGVSQSTTLPVCTVAPVVTGTIASGNVLTCSQGTWINSPTVFSYNWLRDGAFLTTVPAVSTYTLTDADIGHNIECIVVALNVDGSGSSLSNSVGPIAAAPPINTVLPGITGTLQDSSTLSVSNGTWSNSPTGFTYQWSRNGVDINLATNNTYTLVTADVGTEITCTVTASNGSGLGVATTNQVGPILPLAPSNTTAPTISGTITQGNTLTVSNTGVWTNSPTSFQYQWKRDGVSITGETASTYLLSSSDVSHNITCFITAINSGGSGTALSNSLGPIAGAGSLATPVVALATGHSAGVIPVVLKLTDGDYVAGSYLQWEFAGSTTPSTNADGSYAATVQKGVTFIDGESWSRLDLGLGYSQPSGPFAFHCRILKENEAGSITGITDQLGNTFNADGSLWSTNYTDNISASSAVLTHSAGVNMSRLLTINSPYLTYTVNSGGATIMTRADRVASNANFYVENTINAFGTSGLMLMGVTDGAIDLNGQGAGFWGGGGHYPGDSTYGTTISTLTNATTTATVTTSLAHGLQTGASITVSGASPAAYNGTFTVTVTGQKTFTYTMLSDPGGSATTVGSYSCIPYGFTIRGGLGATSLSYSQNGTTGSISLGGPSLAVGDVVGLHYIESSNTYEVYYKSVGGGAGGKIGTTQTLTSEIPSTYYFFVGGTKTNDSGTVNFGATSFAMTAPAGSTYYG